MSENKNIGWICPKCGQVNAPSEKTCSCSSKNFSTQPGKILDEILDNTGFPSNIVTPHDSISVPETYQFIVCPKCGGNIEIPETLCFVGSITLTCLNCGHMITIPDSNIYNYIFMKQ